MPSSKLSRDSWLLITLTAFRTVTELFLGTFLISFIMQLSSVQILSVSMYKLFEYIATTTGFLLFARWCKRRNKVSVLALNVVPKILLLFLIIILGDRVAEYVIPLGLLYGVGAAMYYLPMNSMVGEKVPSQMMNVYMGTQNSIMYAVKVIVPVTLGFFIDTGSYTEVAYVLLAMCVVEFIAAGMLSPSRHRSNSPVDIVGFVRCVLRFPVMRNLFAMEILRGFGQGLISSVITIYTVYMFKTDLNLGIFTTIFSFCSILTSWVVGRISRWKYYTYVLQIFMLLIMLGVSLFIWRTTPVTFLIYNFVYATAIVGLDQVCKTNMFNLSKSRCVTMNHKVEYFVFRDCLLFLGRWIGFVGLMYIGVFGGYRILPFYLALIGLSLVLAGWIAIRILPRVRSRK